MNDILANKSFNINEEEVDFEESLIFNAKNDCIFGADITNKIIENLKKKDLRFKENIQKLLTPEILKIRNECLDFLFSFEIHPNLNLTSIFYSMKLIDILLTLNYINNENFQKISLNCIFLATKLFSPHYHLIISELIKLFPNLINDEFYNFEIEILQFLKYDLFLTTSFTFQLHLIDKIPNEFQNKSIEISTILLLYSLNNPESNLISSYDLINNIYYLSNLLLNISNNNFNFNNKILKIIKNYFNNINNNLNKFILQKNNNDLIEEIKLKIF